VFYKDKDGNIFHTYSAYARGTESTVNTYNYLDYVPKGRDEDSLPFTMSWVRHHDRYDDGHLADADRPYWPGGSCSILMVRESRFVKDKSEWTGTEIVFEIDKKGNQTELRFTHVGLVPAFACYGGGSDAWGFLISDSLRSLITTGKGQPYNRE
jgi:hypothetical protein